MTAGRYDEAFWTLRTWAVYATVFRLPFLFESIMTGEEIFMDRANFVLSFNRLQCVDAPLYQRVLRFYALDDATESRAMEIRETCRMLEEMM